VGTGINIACCPPRGGPKTRKPFIGIAVLALSTTAFGSGSYRGKGPTPPNRIEAAEYNLGKKIFNRKAELPEASPELVKVQAEKLGLLEAALPEKDREQADLSALAGRLSEEQLEALHYYVSIRYKVKVTER
jgi:hypothetical protein